MTETTFNQRFTKILSLLNIKTDVDISKKLGISRQDLQNYKASGSPGVEKLALILKAIPSINPIWLITGEGNMLIDNNLIAESEAIYRSIEGESDLIKFAWKEDREELNRLRKLVQDLTEELINCNKSINSKEVG